ncbi:hypothetical protein [Burkholderia vietnamiensis]|uniref:hypothetical protein n=1 Tax=Burkholderia vietnamiensis TaxID=60552 RepID=UPI000770DD18|nr:hypothetical protein [Burkholderia vietnamiensis]KVR79474.1 hypothetical protein WK24_31365 [Burkholderia vietnamiensis]MBR8087721.1 hypothetical protein [Burkholderia vietnamiensis]MDN7665066.1 hypothetical protein [Burkholderia vietnamiensis]MDN7820981.1 hypothetical protein [Burkholderia vietnamiensis]
MSDTNNQRTHKVGPLKLKVNRVQPTTLDKTPMYAVCTPDRWGMRYSDEDPERRDHLMYPIARDYAKAIQDVLLSQVQWGNQYFGPAGGKPTLKLEWPLESQIDQLSNLIRPVAIKALTSATGGFGIPEAAVPNQLGFYVPTPDRPAGEQGAFSPNNWSLLLNVSALAPMFKIDALIAKTSPRMELVGPLKTFSDTLYHEARHCQQWFWIYALAQQHPDNFETLPNIAKWPQAMWGGTPVKDPTTSIPQGKVILDLTSKQSIPTDTATLISIKRMAVGQYVYALNIWRKVGYRPPYLTDAAALEDEFQRARAAAINLLQHVGIGGTSIDVDAMVAEPSTCYCDYTARPWENDAFVCGEMATAYWNAGMGLGLSTYAPDQCSHAYQYADATSKRTLRGSDAGSGTGGTGEGQ